MSSRKRPVAIASENGARTSAAAAGSRNSARSGRKPSTWSGRETVIGRSGTTVGTCGTGTGVTGGSPAGGGVVSGVSTTRTPAPARSSSSVHSARSAVRVGGAGVRCGAAVSPAPITVTSTPVRSGMEHRRIGVDRDTVGRTLFVVEDEGATVGTITVDKLADTDFWTHSDLVRSALYVHRMAVARNRSGEGIGSAMLNWACSRALQQGGPRSAWTRGGTTTTCTGTTRSKVSCIYGRNRFPGGGAGCCSSVRPRSGSNAEPGSVGARTLRRAASVAAWPTRPPSSGSGVT